MRAGGAELFVAGFADHERSAVQLDAYAARDLAVAELADQGTRVGYFVGADHWRPPSETRRSTAYWQRKTFLRDSEG